MNEAEIVIGGNFLSPSAERMGITNERRKYYRAAVSILR